MKLLITGICGFVGSTLAKGLLNTPVRGERTEIIGIDNFIRPGSESNRAELAARGIKVIHGDLRCASDLGALPAVDGVIDAAANPSVLAGVDGKSSSSQVFDHNLLSTINLLEYCKLHRASFNLLSTSRVYSIPPLAGLPVVAEKSAFRVDTTQSLPQGVSKHGVAENFSVAPPISLYGASKLASEVIAMEYGMTFNFPVWINRCGVLAGAGQFGRADQGIFAFWINAYLRRKSLKYIGFDGMGHQARDALHPLDLVPVLLQQFAATGPQSVQIHNLGGGEQNTMSLRQISEFCRDRFGFEHSIASDLTPRPFDIPWMVMDSQAAANRFGFQPKHSALDICNEIADHAERNPNWLILSNPT